MCVLQIVTAVTLCLEPLLSRKFSFHSDTEFSFCIIRNHIFLLHGLPSSYCDCILAFIYVFVYFVCFFVVFLKTRLYPCKTVVLLSSWYFCHLQWAFFFVCFFYQRDCFHIVTRRWHISLPPPPCLHVLLYTYNCMGSVFPTLINAFLLESQFPQTLQRSNVLQRATAICYNNFALTWPLAAPQTDSIPNYSIR